MQDRPIVGVEQVNAVLEDEKHHVAGQDIILLVGHHVARCSVDQFAVSHRAVGLATLQHGDTHFIGSLFVVGFEKVGESWHNNNFARGGFNPRQSKLFICELGSRQRVDPDCQKWRH